jgi:hypothetical protein
VNENAWDRFECRDIIPEEQRAILMLMSPPEPILLYGFSWERSPGVELQKIMLNGHTDLTGLLLGEGEALVLPDDRLWLDIIMRPRDGKPGFCCGRILWKSP